MKNILVVEDDFYIRDIYNSSLSEAGYQVTPAEDGEEALIKLKNQRFDLILLDLMLPKVNGIEVLKKIKDKDSLIKDVPVYVVTNMGDEHVIKEALKIGAEGQFLKVSLTPQDLVNEVNAFFSSQEDNK